MKKLLLLSILSLFLHSCSLHTPKNGQKIGRIVKIADEGLLCTTCEGELIRGGLVDGSGTLGSSFHFTINDRKIKEKAYEAFETQSEVIMTYETPFFVWAWTAESHPAHFVKFIEVLR